ncbi:MAG: tRNA guanosine(34) transglycosylase Tgt [Holosporales bacterium]|jgi:queuine tRNA-ribosyltransferase|nr:tRNA guanosine(34) transglycosylase Tgt [Holosporales bacterium]
MFSFQILKNKRDSNARRGRIVTPHRNIETPAFVFCATKGDIKGVTTEHLYNENTQFILSNTYHLMLQPGSQIVKSAGGLHEFVGWRGPMMTDSGGFQIFSLGHGGVASEIKGSCIQKHRNKTVLEINEEGAYFKSYIDGQKILLTPEKSIQIQMDLGADIIVSFDECTPYHVDKTYTANSMRKSKRWGKRSLEYFKIQGDVNKQALLSVIQGGIYKDLRQESADFSNENEFFAFAIGGSLGRSQNEMQDIVSMTNEMLDKKRYTHLLGIGGISDIFHGVRSGIDTFDCVGPTRIARHGTAIVKKEGPYMNLCNSRFKNDNEPIDRDCPCYTCRNFSRSYIHHLIKAKEILSGSLISIHNIRTMNNLMQDIRNGITNECLNEVQSDWCDT